MCGKHRLPKFFSACVNPLFSKQGVHDCRKQKVNAVYVWAVGVKTVPLIKDQVVFDDMPERLVSAFKVSVCEPLRKQISRYWFL